MNQETHKSWEQIGRELTNFFGICACQRKLKTIVDNLVSIRKKCTDAYVLGTPRDFTGAEWLLIALMDADSYGIAHGTNCEYPIIIEDHPFWKWIDEVKDNPNLEDN